MREGGSEGGEGGEGEGGRKGGEGEIGIKHKRRKDKTVFLPLNLRLDLPSSVCCLLVL